MNEGNNLQSRDGLPRPSGARAVVAAWFPGLKSAGADEPWATFDASLREADRGGRTLRLRRGVRRVVWIRTRPNRRNKAWAPWTGSIYRVEEIPLAAK